ncbi:MAG: orotidine-5'-phosphate decarboxylase [Pseudomonadota bacterium]
MDSVKEKIIVALDVPTEDAALKIIEETYDYVGYYKVGLGFLAGDGIGFTRRLVEAGHKIFLDLKLFDIGQTITDAVARLADTGIKILTVHGDPYVISAAIRGRGLSGNKNLNIYAVTILTSLDEADIDAAGYSMSLPELVLFRAQNASNAGADGVIASGHECRVIKAQGYGLKVITPGVRSNGVAIHDQKRVMKPKEAIIEGADHLVIGREITTAASPKNAAKHIYDALKSG